MPVLDEPCATTPESAAERLVYRDCTFHGHHQWPSWRGRRNEAFTKREASKDAEQLSCGED